METFRAGLDVGSTTAKLMVLDEDGQNRFSLYCRHGAAIGNTLADMFESAVATLGDCRVCLSVTGSAGMGIAERACVPFVQEVIAAGEVVQRHFPDVRTLIDIGGEDSKMMFFVPDRPPDIRMNGSCAGGTGAFIDQMATLLDLSLSELNVLAERHAYIHPIASRCGVFAKTDVQNLVSRKIDTADICASILHAVAVQNLNSLTRGIEIRSKVLFCGGPLTFLSALRTRFQTCLKLCAQDIVLPEGSQFFPARGAALQTCVDAEAQLLSEWRRRVRAPASAQPAGGHRLPPLFADPAAYQHWETGRAVMRLTDVSPAEAETPFFLGIDSGSTTTKVMVIDCRRRIVFSDYRPNRGNPIGACLDAVRSFRDCMSGVPDRRMLLAAAAVTGYGEDLIRAALDLDHGIVETLAHWRAASECDPKVSFILDIGGQDMKAIFVGKHGIDRIEINEACSSGCGSFIEGFAQSLGLTAGDFSQRACCATAPCDLGTRCTVFMNSRIKQAQRENATIEDIAAGLAYAVIKNSLYKVLKLRDPSELGDRIVVQGGTFRNRAVLRALEVMADRTVTSADRPEMMGAFGAALIAEEAFQADPASCRPVDPTILDTCSRYTTRAIQCRGCTNQCVVTRFDFDRGRIFHTGNRCERIFSNRGRNLPRGRNLFIARNRYLFERSMASEAPSDGRCIGIPRILGMYEDFPFWCSLLTGCGFKVVLSGESTHLIYEKGLGTVMSDNICFPAKLAHGHVVDLVERGVDRIFYPMTIHEPKDSAGAVNSFNCPIVTGYSDVLKGIVEEKGRETIPFDTPAVSFRDEGLLEKACWRYLKSLKVSRYRFEKAFRKALAAQCEFRDTLYRQGQELLDQARAQGRMVIVLAGRPYHADPLIEHQTSDLLADLGVDVLPVDPAARMSRGSLRDLVAVPQWAWPNRLLKAAQWVAGQGNTDIQYVMLNSFGCGPDAFIMDEIRDVLSAAGKTFTLIKIDEIFSTGSVRLRLRSLVETRNSRSVSKPLPDRYCRVTTASCRPNDRRKPIIVPYFSDFYSPFFPPIFRLLGYDLQNLPPADELSVQYGLAYANNEVCYPAIVVVGDIIKAFKTGQYDPEQTVVGMTQTGGQCRASNYLALIKKALAAAGYPSVPVMSVSYADEMVNNPPGFEFDFRRIIRPAFTSLLYADAIARMYYRSVVRERLKGQAGKVRDHYLKVAPVLVENKDVEGLLKLLRNAVRDFNDVVAGPIHCPRIGIVGEIFLKYNRFSQMHVIDWLVSQGVEVVVPCLLDFVMQFFVNEKVNRECFIQRGGVCILKQTFLERQCHKWIRRFEQVLSGFCCYEPPIGIWQKARSASRIVSLTSQFGEGWLIPAEIAGFAGEGIWDVVCLQPFGCIANHVIAKGIERRLKQLYPKVNLLFLDFEAGTSEVNVYNRLHFMIRNAFHNHQINLDRMRRYNWKKQVV